MKIISRIFLDGKFYKPNELVSGNQLGIIPDPEVIAKNIEQLRNSEEDVWGYLILIHKDGITNSPILENDLIINI